MTQIVKLDQRSSQHESLLTKLNTMYQQSLSLSLSSEQVSDLRKKIIKLANELKQVPELQAQSYNIIGRIALDDGFIDKAQLYIEKALKIEPNNPGNLFSYGHIYLYKNQLKTAIEYFSKAHDIDPFATKAQSSLAYCYLALNYPEKAFLNYKELVKHSPKDNHIKSKLFESCSKIKADRFTHKLYKELNYFYEFNGVDFQNLHNLTTSLLILQYNLNNDQPPTLDINDLVDNKLLINGFTHLLFANPLIEKFTISLRKQILFKCLESQKNYTKWLPLIIAIAQQAINNEQILYIDAQEEIMLNHIQTVIEFDLLNDWNCRSISSALMLFAMYQPLTALKNWQNLMEHPVNKWASSTRGLITRSIWNVKTELDIAEKFHLQSPLTNITSIKVQKQYENHPYPRWLQLGYNTATNYGRALENEFHGFRAPSYFNRGELKVLIAGCGTGQHSLKVAKYFRNTNVTAIDLSSRSLAYAQQMADKMNINNIEFKQLDILQLDDLKQYHVIECSGVLHHMQDIQTGFNILKNKLLPSGVMKIALYSKQARQVIDKMRNLIEFKQIQSDQSGIRLLRFALLQSNKNAFTQLFKTADFYSLSGCRDLLFHVSEITSTPIQIKALCENNKVKFLGFVRLDGNIKQSYLTAYPEDPAMLNLENWAEFEKTNHCFESMYQFYIQN
ncbi:MAG: methyltransferase domain-containing protein [Saccharospirillaceae bacterium]|nr:methyltransferase domain-containing protein [Pseudomonadales bacterium]NRB80445.1 methyltransferase domain-containing protein [Saccharospirillaceae bacterium]